MTRKPPENTGGPLAPWLCLSSTLLSASPSAASLPTLAAGQWVQPPRDEQPPSRWPHLPPTAPSAPAFSDPVLSLLGTLPVSLSHALSPMTYPFLHHWHFNTKEILSEPDAVTGVPGSWGAWRMCPECSPPHSGPRATAGAGGPCCWVLERFLQVPL